MSITSKPVGLGANPLTTLGSQLSTLERKLNKLEAQLVRAATANAPSQSTMNQWIDAQNIPAEQKALLKGQTGGSAQSTMNQWIDNQNIPAEQKALLKAQAAAAGGTAAAGNTGFVPAGATTAATPGTAANGNTGFVPPSNQGPRSLDDLWKMAVGPETPNPTDSSHPSGGLKADANTGVVTTPGGYKIEQLDKFDWKITGPDGKETKIWGDPHVAEGDGGKWDFKRDSTFVLGDGTRINVTTKPYGNDMTVTGELEIISGNDRVKVTDIDKGKGKVGTVTQDGFQHVNSFGGKDVFVMGKESDDWSFTGKEIVGSNNGGESFKLGKELAAGSPAAQKPPTNSGAEALLKQMRDVFKGLADVFRSFARLSETLGRRAEQDGGLTTRPGPGDWLSRRQDRLRNDFDSIGRMLHLFRGLDHLSKAVQPFRNNFTA